MATKLPVDAVFRNQLERVSDFAFNETVAGVFDDMVARSVPFYAEIQRMLAELAASFATEGSNIYDLGCSTGTTLALLHETLPVNAHLCGIDYSAEMLDKCRAKLAEHELEGAIELRQGDLDEGVDIENASVVLMILTLMFVRPLNREKLMRRLHAGMNENSCLLGVEKVLGDGSLFNRLFIERYYAFKRRKGYSEPLGWALPIVAIGLYNMSDITPLDDRPYATGTLLGVLGVTLVFCVVSGWLKKIRSPALQLNDG